MNTFTLRQRRILKGLIGLFAVSMVLLLVVVNAPRSFSATPLTLELTVSAKDFREVLLRDWLQAPEPQGALPSCGIGVTYLPDIAQAGGALPSFGSLRCNLFVDSVGFVPAYVALLLFFTLAFGPPVATHPWLRQLLCVPAVAAGLFDVAENSMTGRALDDLIQFALVDATVADVTMASRVKWLLLSLAFAMLAWRVAVDATDDKPWNAVAAAACGVAVLALGAGGALVSHEAIGTGMAAALTGVGVLAWRALRPAPAVPPAPGA